MLLKTAQSWKIDPAPLITHHFKLDAILGAYDTLSRAADAKVLKVII
jgi:alcohol dehydrogenase